MKTDHDISPSQVCRDVDEHRRGFLRRLLAGGVAVTATPVLAANAAGADAPVAPARGRGGKGRAGMGGPVTDTDALAERLIKEFDKDGDKALNQAELAEAMKTVHERSRRAQGKGVGGGQAGGGAAGQGGTGGQARGKGAGAAGGGAAGGRRGGAGGRRRGGAAGR